MSPALVASTPRARAGLTLVELLTATAIALALSVLATVSFMKILKEQQRLTSRLAMHNSARFVYQNMSESLSSLQPDAAMWLESSADDGSGNGTVSLTFLRGKLDEHDFATNSARWWAQEANAEYQTRCTDLTWCCWKWSQQKQTLYSGVCSHPRAFKLASPWAGPIGNYGNGNTWFMNMPQPLQLADPYPSAGFPAGGSAAALNGNRYGSPDLKNDISDYQDLAGNLAPVMRHVTAFHIEMQLADGSIVDADDSQTTTLGCDGNFVDARCSQGADGALPYLKRPRLIRTLIDLRDPVTGVTQSFSFSYRPTGVLPKSYRSGRAIP
jgi:Tfp pilus assembly protein PilE